MVRWCWLNFLLIWMKEGQGPIVLAVGAGGVVWTFILSSIISLFFLPLSLSLSLSLSLRQPDID